MGGLRVRRIDWPIVLLGLAFFFLWAWACTCDYRDEVEAAMSSTIMYVGVVYDVPTGEAMPDWGTVAPTYQEAKTSLHKRDCLAAAETPEVPLYGVWAGRDVSLVDVSGPVPELVWP